MLKKTIWILFIGTMLLCSNSFAQQRTTYSQYLFNALALNPAFAGSQDQVSVSAIYRNQWTNIEGAPEIYTLTGNTAFSKKRIGLGFVLTNDKIGAHNDLSLYLSYAYRIRFRRGVLAMGLQGGFNQLKTDYSRITIQDTSDPNLTGLHRKFNPNFGAGLFFTNSTTYIGFSVPYLVNSKVFDAGDDGVLSRARRYYFLSAGRVFPISENFKFKPSTLIRFQERAPLGADINLQLIYKNIISVGNSYRSGESNIMNFEIQFTPNFRLGYAYEIVLSKLGQHTNGSHEVMVNYRINIPGLNKGVECPTYF